MPLPREDFRQILPVLSDVVLMFDQKIVHFLIQMSAAVSKLRQMLERLLDEAEAVDMVLHAHIEGRRDRALFQIAMYEEILFVVSAMRQLVNQLRIAVERKDYRFVLGEQRIKLRVSPCGCSMFDCSFIKSTPLTKRIFSSGM